MNIKEISKKSRSITNYAIEEWNENHFDEFANIFGVVPLNSTEKFKELIELENLNDKLEKHHYWVEKNGKSAISILIEENTKRFLVNVVDNIIRTTYFKDNPNELEEFAFLQKHYNDDTSYCINFTIRQYYRIWENNKYVVYYLDTGVKTPYKDITGNILIGTKTYKNIDGYMGSNDFATDMISNLKDVKTYKEWTRSDYDKIPVAFELVNLEKTTIIQKSKNATEMLKIGLNKLYSEMLGSGTKNMFSETMLDTISDEDKTKLSNFLGLGVDSEGNPINGVSIKSMLPNLQDKWINLSTTPQLQEFQIQVNFLKSLVEEIRKVPRWNSIGTAAQSFQKNDLEVMKSGEGWKLSLKGKWQRKKRFISQLLKILDMVAKVNKMETGYYVEPTFEETDLMTLKEKIAEIENDNKPEPQEKQDKGVNNA